MYITVQEIINLPIFNLAKVRTGIELLDQRKVDWVSAIEGPVENFVRREEFVITTGMGFEHKAELFYQFVQDVYESGASALGIAVGRYIFEIPEEIIQFAEEKQFVLIELPWELRFADIQRETMRAISLEQEKFSEQARLTQRKLIDFVVVGKNIADIIRYVEGKLACQIIFADSKGRVKSASASPEHMLRLWDELEAKGEVNTDESSSRHIQKALYQQGYLLKKEITSGTQTIGQGYFIIYLPNRKLYNPNTLQIMESLSAATALWMSREDAIVKTEIRLRNEFIWGLAKTPQMNTDDRIQSRAKLFGYKLGMPYICLVGYSENFDSFYEQEYGQEDFGFKSIIYYIEEEVRYAASVVSREVAFTFDDDRLIIYLQSEQEEESTVHHFLDLVDKRLHALIPGVRFSWGMGMHLDGTMQFHESYKKAHAALDLARKQKDPQQRMSFADTQLNRLLLHLVHDEEVRAMTLATIAPLIEYEEKREMDLIQTFITYDNQNGNVSQAARVLNLHRQSLLYRLRKIESITNLSLVNPDDVFLLNISIKVWRTGALET
jgi:purine catabolism regulator